MTKNLFIFFNKKLFILKRIIVTNMEAPKLLKSENIKKKLLFSFDYTS